MFQFIARHLLYTPEHYSGGKFRNFPPLLSHVCPAALSFDGYEINSIVPTGYSGGYNAVVLYCCLELPRRDGVVAVGILEN